MGVNGIAGATIFSVLIVVFIWVFISLLNTLIVKGTPGSPATTLVCREAGDTSDFVYLDGTVEGYTNRPFGEVTGRLSSGETDLVMLDGTQCTTASTLGGTLLPNDGTNENTFIAFTPRAAAVAEVPGELLGAPGYEVAVVILRIISAIAGLGIIVVIWRRAMTDN